MSVNRFQDFTLSELRALESLIDPSIKVRCMLSADSEPVDILTDLKDAINTKTELESIDFSDFDLESGGCESGACHL